MASRVALGTESNVLVRYSTCVVYTETIIHLHLLFGSGSGLIVRLALQQKVGVDQHFTFCAMCQNLWEKLFPSTVSVAERFYFSHS